MSKAAVILLLSFLPPVLLLLLSAPAFSASASTTDEPTSMHPASGAAVEMDRSGLAAIWWAGHDFVQHGQPRMDWLTLTQPDGSQVAGGVSAATSVDAASNAIDQRYPWGTVRCVFTAECNRVRIDVSIANESASTISGFCLRLAELQFPKPPKEYDGVTPMLAHNRGSPTVLTESFPGGGVMVLTNEDVATPLMVGFPWALNAEKTVFPLNVSTARHRMYPTSLPFIDRPIPPGETLRVRLALRFGPAGSTPDTLASDVYRKFAAAFPARLDWKDRRPVAALFVSRSRGNWPKNPRGFLNDGTVDVTTAEGRGKLKRRMLAYADQSIAIMRRMDAQGMITWDLEGQEFPHAVSYIGDPRQIETLAPEMRGVVNEYFAKFRAAGFRTGVTIRPQRLALEAGKKRAEQRETENPARMLIDKIAYARSRWGASLFYIDSNGDANDPLDTQWIAQVAAAHPGVLLIPEHENTSYYSVCAPFGPLNRNAASTPARVRLAYERAFGVTYVADGDFQRHWTNLVNGVRHGDILLFRGWFDSAENAKVKQIYREAATQQRTRGERGNPEEAARPTRVRNEPTPL